MALQPRGGCCENVCALRRVFEAQSPRRIERPAEELGARIRGALDARKRLDARGRRHIQHVVFVPGDAGLHGAEQRVQFLAHGLAGKINVGAVGGEVLFEQRPLEDDGHAAARTLLSSSRMASAGPSATILPSSMTTARRAQLRDELQIVGGDDLGGLDRPEQDLEEPLPPGIEAAGRLVQGQDPRPAGQETGQADPLLLSAAQVVGRARLESGKLDLGQALTDDFGDVPLPRSELTGPEGDVLEDRRRQNSWSSGSWKRSPTSRRTRARLALITGRPWIQTAGSLAGSSGRIPLR